MKSLTVTETGKEIKNMYDLADYINNNEEYPLDVEDIVTAAGWINATKDEDIAYNPVNHEYITFTDSGKVEVLPLPNDYEF